MSASGREVHPGSPGVVGRSSRMSGSGREFLSGVREWSGCPSGCPGVVGRPSRMSGIAGDALPDDSEWSEGPPLCPGLVGRPFRMSWIGQKVGQEVRE